MQCRLQWCGWHFAPPSLHTDNIAAAMQLHVLITIYMPVRIACLFIYTEPVCRFILRHHSQQDIHPEPYWPCMQQLPPNVIAYINRLYISQTSAAVHFPMLCKHWQTHTHQNYHSARMRSIAYAILPASEGHKPKKMPNGILL